MKQQFKNGDIVVCRKSHAGSKDPSWVVDMERLIGTSGVVCGVQKTTGYIDVNYFAGGQWLYLPDWLEMYTLENKQENKMSCPVKETFTTTWSLDITLTDGKVTAVNVHPPAPPEPQKPKFAVGDIVVCKVKPREMPEGYKWTNEMTLMLNIPGRVAYTFDNKPKVISVEFGGYQQRFAYPEECLEHETSEMAAAINQMFSRIDKAKKSVCIGTSTSFN